MVAMPRMVMSAQDNTPLNAVNASQLQYMDDERSAQRALVATYREYMEGDQTARLNTDQLSKFPDGKDPDHVLNVCPVIVNTIADRLKIEGVHVMAVDNEALGDELTKTVREWWDAAQMDMTAQHLHSAAGRDGDAYLIADFHEDRPRWTLNTQYTDADGGVDIIYDEGTNEPLYATKRWLKINPDDPSETWSRLNVYYEDRVEKFISEGMSSSFTDAGYLPYTGDAEGNEAADPDQPHIEWWTHDNSATGEALGLPVIHFPANSDGANYGRSDLADVAPALQDNLSDASVDLRIATKFAGSRLRYIFGIDIEESELSNWPGGLMTSKKGEGVTAGEFAESNLLQLISAKDSIYRDISTVTSIPLPNINPTAQVAAEGTLQQQEAPLIAKVEKRQPVFGNRYEAAIKLALKIASAAGLVTLSFEQIDALSVSVQWKPAELRNALVDAQRATLWRDNGVPEQIIWREVLGMSPEVIEEAKDLQDEARSNTLEESIIAGQQRGLSELRALGAGIRERRNGTTNGNGQQEAGEGQGDGLPQADAGGA